MEAISGKRPVTRVRGYPRDARGGAGEPGHSTPGSAAGSSWEARQGCSEASVRTHVCGGQKGRQKGDFCPFGSCAGRAPRSILRYCICCRGNLFAVHSTLVSVLLREKNGALGGDGGSVYTAGTSDTRSLRELTRLSDGLSMVADEDAAYAATAAWVRAFVAPDAVVSVARPDALGRLRLIWQEGEQPDVDRKRSLRRAAFESGRARRVPVPGTPGKVLVMQPVTSNDESMAVLEVVGSEDATQASGEVLDIVANLLATNIRRLTERAELQRAVETMERFSGLGSEIIRSRSIEDGVRIAVHFVAERLQVPVAGWQGEPGGPMHLVEVQGIGTRGRRRLRESMETLLAWDDPHAAWRRDRERFQEIADVEDASVVDVGGAVILAGCPSEPSDVVLRTIGSLLGEVIHLLDASSYAVERREHLNMGLAWTAHELRGPLLGIHAALQLVLARRQRDPREAAIVRRSLHELELLVDTADGLLGWAVGARELQPRLTDVVRIVEEAAASCRLEIGEDRLAVFAPPQLMAHVDVTPMRSTIANLIRNALTHADPGTKVEVDLESDGDDMLLSVSNEGPEIPVEERNLVFDPFVRGRTNTRSTSGSGLGLFIVQRVVEAHGGRIWIDSDLGRTTFNITAPIRGVEQRFAS